MTSYIPNLLVPDTAVAGLTAYIQVLLEQDNQLRQVWVTGSLSSNRHRSGLFYLQMRREISCVVCWPWTN